MGRLSSSYIFVLTESSRGWVGWVLRIFPAMFLAPSDTLGLGRATLRQSMSLKRSPPRGALERATSGEGGLWNWADACPDFVRK